MHYDVAIIGAGLSGLAAGVRLAHFGKKVAIFERHTVPGGLNSFYKKGGFKFDTGLHAVTNWVRPGYRGPRIPLQRVSRQLRFDLGELELDPQTFSEAVLAGRRLSFTNDVAHLEAEVAAQFPGEIDGFRRLIQRASQYPEFSTDTPFVSTRSVLGEYIRDPHLQELILAPILFYGSALENDLDFEQFIILFSSIYLEGFARPRRGIRQILDLLLERYRAQGGLLIRGCGVERIEVAEGRVSALQLSNGERVTADAVVSTAGRVETARLRSDRAPDAEAEHVGRLAFVETIWVLDRPVRDLGHEGCVTFFSTEPRLAWEQPEAPVDLRSGVICCPSNYLHPEPPTPMIRATHIARPDVWFGLEGARYEEEKARWCARSRAAVEAQLGRRFSEHVVYEDAFTPRTVYRYTSKVNGAIYGSPSKNKTGATDLPNLFLAGTDQGLLGIVGSMLSGIAVVNKWVLGGAA